MKIHIGSMLRSFYTKYCIWKFVMTNRFLGFENALKLLIYIDKKAVVPILRKYGATLGEHNDLETPLFFHNCINFSNLSIGDHCHIGKNCFLDLRDKIEIHNNCTIAMGTSLITHFDPGQAKLGSEYRAYSKPIRIHEHCFIGANCTLISGVTLEGHTFVGANSLVINNSDPWSIIVGNPAQKLKQLMNDLEV
jgi:acetyltransferase-like isoleucine patch superfamily enzyme